MSDYGSDSISRNVERIFTENYVYPNWFSKKKYYFYKQVLNRLKKLRYIHSQSAKYYEKLNFRIFAPSISITAISGIASFLSTSDFIGNETQTAF